MSIKSKITGALFAALTIAAPLALSTSPADAAPMRNTMMARHDNDRHDNNNFGRDRGHMDAFHDRNHRPTMRIEYRPRQPHGHYRWHAGQWNWRGGMWVWAPGLWVRF